MNKDKEIRDILVQKLLQTDSLEYSVVLARAIGRLCFTIRDIEECRNAIIPDFTTPGNRHDCADFVLLCNIRGVHFIRTFNAVDVYYRPFSNHHKTLLLGDLDMSDYIGIPQVHQEILQCMARIREGELPGICFRGRPVTWVDHDTFSDDEASLAFKEYVEKARQSSRKSVTAHDFTQGDVAIMITHNGYLRGGKHGTAALETLKDKALGLLDVLASMCLDLNDMLFVDPSVIKEAPRLQQMIAQSIIARHEEGRGFASSCLRLLSLDLRLQLRDAIRRKISNRNGLWRVVDVVDALHDMDIDQVIEIVGTERTLQDIPWMPVSLQRKLVRRFFETCAASEDPVSTLVSMSLPRCVRHREAWAEDVVKPFKSLIAYAAQAHRESEKMWEILQYVSVEALEDFYIEEIRLHLQIPGHWEKGLRTLLAFGALPTERVRRHRSLLRTACRRWGHQANYVCLRHGMTDIKHYDETNIDFRDLRLLEPERLPVSIRFDEQDVAGSCWNDEKARADFFNMDPHFIANVLVRVADKYSTMMLNGAPWPFSDQLAILERMPRSLLGDVARQGLTNGRTLMEEFVVRATGMDYVYYRFLECLLLVDRECLHKDIALPFVEAWLSVCDDVYDRRLLHMVKGRFC